MPDPFDDPFAEPPIEDPFADDPFADPFEEAEIIGDPFADAPIIDDPFAEPPEYSGRRSEPDPYVRSSSARSLSKWDKGLKGFSFGTTPTNSDRHYTPGGKIQSVGAPNELYGLPAHREYRSLFADGEIMQGMHPILEGGRNYHEPGPRSYGPGIQDHPLSFAMREGPPAGPLGPRQNQPPIQPQMPAPPQHLGPQQGGGNLIQEFGPLLKMLMQGRQ